jgi:hypothetical protein
MKQISTLIAIVLFSIVTTKGNAQFTENFDNSNSITNLSGNCWQFVGINHSSDGVVSPITGTGSVYSNPPVSASGTRDINTPFLNINSTSFTVKFNYQLSASLNGSQTRTIEIGLLDTAGVFSSLQIITMDHNSPTTVQNFNQTFTLASTTVKRLVIKMGGTNGGGNVRTIFDDLYSSANAYYGNSTPCNSAPIAVNDNFTGVTGQQISGNVMANDNEPNGEAMTSTVVVTSADGTVVLNQNGSFTFTPNVSFFGSSTTFTYQLRDNGYAPLTSNIATVTLSFSIPIGLPVKLISFNAMLINNKVDLKWVTASEKNASHFVIEKSTDGSNFSDIGVVFAYGNTNEQKSYEYTDNISTSNNAVIYYRLRQVDVDGKFDYSTVRIIRIGKQAENTITILTYPNPVSSELRVTVPNGWQGKKIVYELFTMNGQVSKRSETTNGGQTETINVSTLSTGIYIMKATCGDQIAQQKIVKQ